MSRLRHLCRRGLHELDFLLHGLPDRATLELSPTAQSRLEALLAEVPDPMLLAWLMGTAEPPRAVDDLVAWMRRGDMAAVS